MGRKKKDPRPCANPDCCKIILIRKYCDRCQKRKQRGLLKPLTKKDENKTNSLISQQNAVLSLGKIKPIYPKELIDKFKHNIYTNIEDNNVDTSFSYLPLFQFNFPIISNNNIQNISNNTLNNNNSTLSIDWNVEKIDNIQNNIENSLQDHSNDNSNDNSHSNTNIFYNFD